MISMFNIPNIFTACNMLCGILAILLSVSGRIDLAPFAIFLGAVLDFFDGFLARLLKQQGELGKQLDSLADMITFGLAPGIMMMVLLCFIVGKDADMPLSALRNMENDLTFVMHVQMSFEAWFRNLMSFTNVSLVPLTALLIPFMSMFRLAKFNIDTRQSVSFIGLPTPANTIFFTAFPLILFSQNASRFEQDMTDFFFQPVVLIPIIILMSVLLIAEIPLFALKFKNFKWNGNQIRYIFLITCLILIPILLVWAIPIIVLLYILLSVIENILKRKQHEIQS